MQSEDLRLFFEELRTQLANRRPERVWFLSLGWRQTLFHEIAVGTQGDSVVVALRASLANSRERAFVSGSRVGGGLTYPIAWSALEEALLSSHGEVPPVERPALR